MTSDPNNVCVLTVARSEPEAAIVVSYLAEEGIEAWIGGTGTSTGWPYNVADTRVVVRQADEERARALLDSVRPRVPSGPTQFSLRGLLITVVIIALFCAAARWFGLSETISAIWIFISVITFVLAAIYVGRRWLGIERAKQS